MSEKTPIGLIIRALRNEIDQEERSLLEAWKATSMENVEIYDEIKRAWELSGEYKPPLDFDHEEAFNEFRKKYVESNQAEPEERSRAEAPVKKLKPGKVYIPVAAALLIFIAGIFIWRYYFANPRFTEKTGPGVISELVLPDGSQAWLNENSRITFLKRSYLQNREVILSGNGYFQVIEMENMPFHVMAPTVTVRVTGTSFHVDHYNLENVQVIVDEGRVEVLHLESENSIQLNGGEIAHLNPAGEISLERIQSPNHAAWKNRGLSFIATPLSVAIADIEQYYDISFRVDTSVLKDKSWTSPNLSGSTVQEIITILEENFQFEINEEEDRLYSIQEK